MLVAGAQILSRSRCDQANDRTITSGFPGQIDLLVHARCEIRSNKEEAYHGALS